jgi:hypothetical protein
MNASDTTPLDPPPSIAKNLTRHVGGKVLAWKQISA